MLEHFLPKAEYAEDQQVSRRHASAGTTTDSLTTVYLCVCVCVSVGIRMF